MSTETKAGRRVGVGWEGDVEFDVPVVKALTVPQAGDFHRVLRDYEAHGHYETPSNWLYQLLREDFTIRDEENRSPPSSSTYKF